MFPSAEPGLGWWTGRRWRSQTGSPEPSASPAYVHQALCHLAWKGGGDLHIFSKGLGTQALPFSPGEGQPHCPL